MNAGWYLISTNFVFQEFKVDNDLGDCRKLLVKNPNHISEKALRNLFKRYGPIKELTVTPEYTLIEYEHYK